MTRPGDSDEGSAWIELHSDGSKLQGEMERDTKKAAEAVEDRMDEAGDEWGKTAGKSMGDRLEREAPAIAKKLEDGLRRSKVTTKVRVEYDKDNNVVRRFEETVVTSLQRAFKDASGPGGPISSIGTGIASTISEAVGAGFNVSGRSGLIALLIPVIGAIVGLVIAAIQAVSALVTLLASLPVLIASIGAQAGVFIIAFQGMGEAIQGAFAAKNAKELNEALKGLTPSAQAFVRELLPLRQLFSDIQKSVQQNFFAQLKGDITAVAKALGPLFSTGLSELATTMGGLLHQVAGFLSSPLFKDFVNNVFGTTQEFLKVFGPGIGRFFKGLIELAIAATPLLDDFGKQFSTFMANIGRFFSEVANDPQFQTFLEDMGDTFFNIFRVINSASTFLASFMGMLNQVGGNDVIQALADAFDQLAFFFQTPLGEEGLKGFIDLAIFSIKAVTGLIELFFTLIAVVRNTWPALLEFFRFVGGAIMDFVHMVGQWFTDLWHKVQEGGRGFIAWVMRIPHAVGEAFSNAGGFLLQAGRNIINGLIQGIREKIGPLDNILNWIAGKIRSFFPFSPAKVGPLSGSGDPLIAGGKIVQRLGEGMHMEIPSLRASTENVANNITFGAGAIQQNFQGLPSNTQAQNIGTGVATGITNGLTARDARIAIRTL